jgi:hypothetical protein
MLFATYFYRYAGRKILKKLEMQQNTSDIRKLDRRRRVRVRVTRARQPADERDLPQVRRWPERDRQWDAKIVANAPDSFENVIMPV